ncbi:MAG TPA: dihydrolipoamide acetyltransferase family protein [Byssovorax sp.]|jgi:pyruvate dehydrogenase E2 component (dihydrolipoamide acetyltransferase)
MSTYEFKLPDIGEGVAEGEIVKWLVAVGDRVEHDQPLVEVMTDKATVTITSPKAGTIAELRGGVGAIVPVHAVLVVFDLGGAGAKPATTAAAPAPAAAAKSSEPAATAVGDIREDLPGMSLMRAASPPPAAPAHQNGKTNGVTPAYFNAKPLATPATRRLARELGVDLRAVAPTGANGRVTKDDVRGLAKGHAHAPEGPAHLHNQFADHVPARLEHVETEARSTAPVASEAAPARAPQRIAPLAGDGAALEQRTPLRGVRKRIFEGMSRSKHTAAHFTFVEECDVTALKALRERLKPAAEKAGVKLTFLPFFVKAVVAALKRHPSLNSAFDEATQEIVERRVYHIGVASATEAGLIVPVVRNADRKSVLDIARKIADLGADTKAGKVKPEDLGGSTFTITSLGAQGGLFATPILNFPEVGILGIHQMKQKPVVKDGQIVIGDVMLLSLSFDHRIIDGHVGAAFAYEIIGYLEDPDRLFLEMA